MSGSVFHSIATQFRDRYLQPLQFPGSRRTVEDRVSDLENARNGVQPSNSRIKVRAKAQDSPAEPKPGTDAHFDHVMARSADALKRTSYAEGNVEDAAHAMRMKRSGDILQNIRNTSAEHRAAAPLPEERHADAMARTSATLDRIRGAQTSHNEAFHTQARATAAPAQTGPLHTSATPVAAKPQRVTQPGLFGPSQVAPVRSQQQFGLAATAGPRQKPAAGAPAAKKARVTQPGLFPKSAVQPPK
jgi:hypothetical protein